VPAALPFEGGGEGAAAEDGAPEVDADGPLPIIDGNRIDGAADADAGVVDQQIGAAPEPLGLDGEVGDLVVIRDVGAQGVCLPARGLDEAGGLFGAGEVEVGDENERPSPPPAPVTTARVRSKRVMRRILVRGAARRLRCLGGRRAQRS
jgi:hypothetical protein